MTGELSYYAVSPLTFAEGHYPLMSFIRVECGRIMQGDRDTCVLGLVFPGTEQSRWPQDRPISLRVRFDQGPTKQVKFLPGYNVAELLLLWPERASDFIEDMMLSKGALIEIAWVSRKGEHKIYHDYPLGGSWAAIKKMYPKVSPEMFEGELIEGVPEFFENKEYVEPKDGI